MNHRLFLAGAISLPLLAGLASAQQVSTAPLTSSENSDKLEEVKVTATRRTESTEKIPISIEALSQKDLAENGVKGIEDLAAMVPGLQFQANGYSLYSNYTTVAIRGFNSIVGPSTVGIYLDDAPLQGRMSAIGNVGFIFPLVFDLDRVEVARGPQGTLFGASAESGTLRFITRQPSLTDYSGYTHEEIASTDRGALSYEVGAAGGGPIIDDQVGFRVSAWYRRDGGFVDRADPTTGDIISRNANSDYKGALRGALAVKLDDNVLITPALYYQYAEVSNSSLFYPVFSDPQNGEFANGRLAPDQSVEHLVVPSVKMEAPLTFADLTVTASYVDRHFNENLPVESLICSIFENCGSPLGVAYPSSYSDAAPSNTGQIMIGTSQEVRLTSKDPTAVFTWVGGVFHDHRNQTDYQTGLAPAADTGPAGNPLYYIRQTIVDDQIALFGQGDYHFAHGWTATLGARVEEAKANQTNFNGAGAFNSGEPLFATTPTLKEHPLLPKLALSYQADTNDLFYASASKGLRIGGGNNGLPAGCPQVASRTFNNDYVWSYEVGAKNKLFDGRLQLDTSVFHADWHQLQGTVLLPCGLSYVTNLGSATDNGFDMALAALLTDNLRLDVNVGYADLKYSSDVYSSAGQPISLKGEAIQALGFVNPPWDATATLSYSFPLPNGNEVHIRGQYIYHSHNSSPLISQVPSSPSYLPLEVADPATHLVNARLGYEVGKANFELFVNNLLNSHPLLNAYQDEANSNLVTYSTFRPRTVGLSFNWKFK